MEWTAPGSIPILRDRVFSSTSIPAQTTAVHLRFWFTYSDDTASGQRWLTAKGNSWRQADLDIYDTQGSSFDDPQPVESVQVGTMRIDFSDCSHARLRYRLPAEGSEGSIIIRRVVSGGQALCEELSSVQ
jgi:hypothetical protein